MKKLLVVTLLFVAGCLPATQQEVTELTNLINGIVPLVQNAVTESSEETKGKIDVVLGQIVEVNKAVATAEDPIEAIEKGWDASEIWNPYYGYGVLALGIWRILAGKKKVDTALEEVVVGVEDLLKNNPTVSKEPLKAAASIATRKKVDAIRKV